MRKNRVCARLAQRLSLDFTSPLQVRAPNESDAPHARSHGPFDTVRGVLNNHTIYRLDAQCVSCQQKEIRCWFALLYLLCTKGEPVKPRA